MLSLRVILITGLGLIIIFLICPTSGSETTIESLAENTKLFLNGVRQLDSSLKRPPSLKKFRKIKYSRFPFWKIKCSEDDIERFKTELQKLVIYTTGAVNNYINQIDNILVKRHKLGNVEDKMLLCLFYTNRILPKLKITGYGANIQWVQIQLGELKRHLARLYNKIQSLIPIGTKIKVENKTTSCFMVGCFMF